MQGRIIIIVRKSLENEPCYRDIHGTVHIMHKIFNASDIMMYFMLNARGSKNACDCIMHMIVKMHVLV